MNFAKKHVHTFVHMLCMHTGQRRSGCFCSSSSHTHSHVPCLVSEILWCWTAAGAAAAAAAAAATAMPRPQLPLLRNPSLVWGSKAQALNYNPAWTNASASLEQHAWALPPNCEASSAGRQPPRRPHFFHAWACALWPKAVWWASEGSVCSAWKRGAGEVRG